MNELALTEIKVFVSCPGDVSHEKELIKEACDSLNQMYIQSGNAIRFSVLDWKNILSSWGNRPQQVINDQFEGYNIYLGILWMRFGSKTGKVDDRTGEDFGSGTIEEFREAELKLDEGANIEIYLFFKEAIGANSVHASEQHTRVLKFKEEVSSKGWTHTFKNGQDATFTNKVRSILELYVRKLEEKQRKEIREAFDSSDSTSEISLAFANYNSKWALLLPPKEETIARSFSKRANSSQDTAAHFSSEDQSKLLSEIVLDYKRVTVLGTAGSGKSTEMVALANHFAASGNALVPVYKRLNTYVDENLNDFLPLGWTEIPAEICMVLLDGLDEIRPDHFHTAIKRISSFSEQHPNIRIIVSCRTNFYDFIDPETDGTLPGFQVFHINPLNEAGLHTYLQEVQSLDAESFLQEARKHNYNDLILQPFFLNIIVSEYKSRGSLEISRSKLLEQFIEARISFDQRHFKNKINLKEKKTEVLKLVQRVALVMESMGKNYISTDELLEIVGTREKIELLKHCTAFNLREEDGESWSFEHNNVQEYLAARLLGKLPVEVIKQQISFHLTRVKPNWVNTLFFLIGIIDEHKKAALIEWIVEIEPETLIRMEPEQVDENLRQRIFEQIFCHYKSKDIYLRSNKFSNIDFARFPPQDKAFTFLLKEFKERKNSRTTRLTALHLLRLVEIPDNHKQKLKSEMLHFTTANPTDYGLFYSTAGALVSMKMLTAIDLKELMTVFGESANQDARASLYELISNLGLYDQYQDYYLEGIQYLENNHPDRSPSSFYDEEIGLKDGLLQLSSNSAIIKVFDYFRDPAEIKHADFFDRDEILKAMIELAITKGAEDEHLFNSLIQILMGFAAYFDTNLSGEFASFFLKTDSQVRAFQSLYYNTTRPLDERWRAIASITDSNVLDHIKKEYSARNLNNQQLIELFNGLKWSEYVLPDALAFQQFEIWIKDELKLIEEQPTPADPALSYLEMQSKEFQLYFDQPALIAEVNGFFEVAGIEEISRLDLRKYRRFGQKELIHLSEPINRIVVRLTLSDNDCIDKQNILDFMNDEGNFHAFVLNQIYQKSSQRAPELTELQKEIVISWVLDLLKTLDVPLAAKFHDSGQTVNLKRKVILAWHFIRRLDIAVDEKLLREFTLLHVDSPIGRAGTDFPFMEKRLGKAAVISQVSYNLKEKLVDGPLWRSHAIYAVQNKILEVLPLIIESLLDEDIAYPYRIAVLKEFISEQYDGMQFLSLLYKAGKDVLRWDLASTLQKDLAFREELILYLSSILENDNETDIDRFISARMLAELNQLNGFLHFTGALIRSGTPDLNGISLFQTINNTEFITRLLEMINYKQGREPELDEDDDDHDRIADLGWRGLWSIAMDSENNLKLVTDALLLQTENNRETVEKWQDEFYTRNSQVQSLRSAIQMVDEISI